jgi:hypothetical protein
MAIGLTVGAFIVFLMKLEPGQGDDVKRVKQEQQKATKIAEANKTTPSPTQPVKPKYDFYTLLPESEVIVPPDAVPEKPCRRRKCRPRRSPGGSGENRHRPRPGRAGRDHAAATATGAPRRRR